MKKIIKITALFLMVFTLFSFSKPNVNEETYSLTVQVEGLKNSKGVVQFSLYNQEKSIPDEKYKKYYLQMVGEIENGVSSITFKNLPKGRYAVNILHDEDENGKIKKGWIFPIEGIGFSNFTSIGFRNRPNFSKASFEVNTDMTKKVKVIYM